MNVKKFWAVMSANGEQFMQDSGNLIVDRMHEPYGGPGVFGELSSAYEFKSEKDAAKACGGLLGPGRDSRPVIVVPSAVVLQQIEARLAAEAKETARIHELIREIPTPCSGCRRIAHVTSEERGRGRWTCYGCGLVNRWSK